MVLHRKHLLSEKKKTLVAATLAKKIGYLKIQDVVPSGIVEHQETGAIKSGTRNQAAA